MESTITGNLRAALSCLKQALISWDSDEYDPESELYLSSTREFAEINLDFALAHLRHARHIGAGTEFSRTFKDVTGESFPEKMGECIDLIRVSPSEIFRGLFGSGDSVTDNFRVRIASVEDILDDISGLIEYEHLSEEP